MVGEVKERRRRAPLLALEEHGYEGRQEQEGGPHLQQVRADEGRDALPQARLPTWSWFCRQHTKRSRAGRPPVGRGGAGGTRRTGRRTRNRPEGLGQLTNPAEIRVIAFALAGQHGVKGVVEIVVPAGVDAVTVLLAGPGDPRVVAVALGYQPQSRPSSVASRSTSADSSSRMCSAPSSNTACTASRRRPSMW